MSHSVLSDWKCFALNNLKVSQIKSVSRMLWASFKAHVSLWKEARPGFRWNFPILKTVFFWIWAGQLDPLVCTDEFCFLLFSLADFICLKGLRQEFRLRSQQIIWNKTRHNMHRGERQNSIEFNFAPKHMLPKRQITLLCRSLNTDCHLFRFYLGKLICFYSHL